MRALVTGASGFVGQYLLKHLLDSDDQVYACHSATERTNRTPALLQHPEHSSVVDRVTWIPLNITDKTSVAQAISRAKPQVIYHLAGIAFVPEAEENFERTLLINVLGTHNIYDACLRQQLETKVVLVSSAEVYGRIFQSELPINEHCALRPANNYSLSKLMAESVATRYNSHKSITSVILRPFNHIGAGQDRRFVAPSFARQLAQIKSSGDSSAVLQVGNLESLRDFTDVRDIVRGYRIAAEKGSGIYNLGSGISVPVSTILDSLIAASGIKVALEFDPSRMRASEVPEIRADISKAKLELGWEPQIPLEQTLREIYEHAVLNI